MSVRRLMNSNGQKLIATVPCNGFYFLLPTCVSYSRDITLLSLATHSVMTAVIHSLSCIQLHTPGRQVCGTYSREDPRQ